VSVRSAFGALGTDTGGSIRVPATINGLVGLKPTYGRVSIYGVVPVAWSLDHVGPITRTVQDTALILQAISGYDPNDDFSADELVPDFTAELESGVRGLRVGIERDYFFYEGVSDDVRNAVEAVISEYQQQGAEIVDVSLPELEVTPDAVFTIVLCEGSTYHRHLLREHGDKYDATTRSMVQLGELIPATHYLTAQRARALYRSAMANLFKSQRLDAMLWPTLPLTTVPFDDLYVPRKDGIAETPIVSFVHHSFNANLTGQPALTVPCGLSSAGLPIGFQLIGRPFDEVTVFRLARAYERNHDWFTKKPNLSQ
jgi:aspartyl-tRNA(Asn)/glutamyl-tRNA(Gln) amidotransferase subunit A